jgi:hypothetical protein
VENLVPAVLEVESSDLLKITERCTPVSGDDAVSEMFWTQYTSHGGRNLEEVNGSRVLHLGYLSIYSLCSAP